RNDEATKNLRLIIKTHRIMKRKIYNLISSAKQGLFVLALAVMPSLVYSQAVYTFSYTGSVQTINLSTGPHLIEMWGADGGDNLAANTGGKGGYSTGTLMAVSGTYYVYVGGKGKTQQVANTAVTGGFNGGGDSGAYSSPSSNPG